MGGRGSRLKPCLRSLTGRSPRVQGNADPAPDTLIPAGALVHVVGEIPQEMASAGVMTQSGVEGGLQQTSSSDDAVTKSIHEMEEAVQSLLEANPEMEEAVHAEGAQTDDVQLPSGQFDQPRLCSKDTFDGQEAEASAEAIAQTVTEGRTNASASSNTSGGASTLAIKEAAGQMPCEPIDVTTTQQMQAKSVPQTQEKSVVVIPRIELQKEQTHLVMKKQKEPPSRIWVENAEEEQEEEEKEEVEEEEKEMKEEDNEEEEADEVPMGELMQGRASPREFHESPETFAEQYGLDSRALRSLMSLPCEEQHVVMALVAHQPGSNPSATAWLKVKLAREKPARARLEYLFISLDGRCLSALAALPPETQEAVAMKMGDPIRCRNLSAFVWAEVKVMSSPRTPRHAELCVLPAIAAEVAATGGGPLDDRALGALAKLTPECRSWVLGQINPRTCRNPSAFVCAKIRSSGLLPGSAPPAGETVSQGTPRGPSCQGTPRGPAFNCRSPRSPVQPPSAQEAQDSGVRLASFLARHALDLLSSRAIMELGGKEQEITMGLADWELRTGGDPSQVVNSKVTLLLNDRDKAEGQYLQVKDQLDAMPRKSAEALAYKSQNTYGANVIAGTASPQGRRKGPITVPPRTKGGLCAGGA